jgi:hypothetical protein
MTDWTGEYFGIPGFFLGDPLGGSPGHEGRGGDDGGEVAAVPFQDDGDAFTPRTVVT